MTLESFKNLKHFKESEFINPEKMNLDLLLRLDSFREYVGSPLVITSSTEGSHIENSQHYLGRAVDIIVPDQKGSIVALYLIAERFNFTGIGIYPNWEYQGKKIGGLHLDYREVQNFQGARWIGVKSDDSTKNVYYPLNIVNLKKFGILR